MGGFPNQLIERYRNFKSSVFERHSEHYSGLAIGGQSPEIMIISCCDSRVDPETIFSARPGDLFVVRNVANLVPPYETQGSYHGVSAAIEFAVLNLQINHLIILGHSGCGGISVALDSDNAIQTEANFISKWMSILDEPKAKIMENTAQTHDHQCHELGLEGIKHSIKNLRTFPFVRLLEKRGKLRLHGAIFDIEHGQLSVLNETSGEFLGV
ncbi:MAG: carbonic anhydrase [Hyphomonadaceae bacterium]|nr:MAG: carbonic anhydrase [Hyphomonadaceae bacterium]